MRRQDLSQFADGSSKNRGQGNEPTKIRFKFVPGGGDDANYRSPRQYPDPKCNDLGYDDSANGSEENDGESSLRPEKEETWSTEQVKRQSSFFCFYRQMPTQTKAGRTLTMPA